MARKPINAKRARIKRGEIPAPKKKHKYGAKGTWVDDIFFASKAEATRYGQLKLLERIGEIDRLELQPSFDIVVNNIKVCTYRADFRYRVIDELGREIRVVVEDVKGMVTPVYRLKKKLMGCCHTIQITEIPAKDVKQWASRTA